MTSRKPPTIFPILVRLFFDLLAIPVILVGAYILKFKVGWIFQHVFTLHIGVIYDFAQIEPYLSGLWMMTLIWILTFWALGAYQIPKGLMSEVDEVWTIIKGTSIVVIQLMAILFNYSLIPESRYVLLYIWILGILIIGSIRFVIHTLELRQVKKGGGGAERTLIIGTGSLGMEVAEKLRLFPGLRLCYVGSVGPEPTHLLYTLRECFRGLGTFQDISTLFELIEIQSVKCVLITDEILSKKEHKALTLFANNHQISVFSVRSNPDISPLLFHQKELDGLLIEGNQVYSQGLQMKILKRVMDIIGSLILLCLASPLMILAAIWIKIMSPSGPVFYLQSRVGLNNVVFNIIKFRTMVPDAEKDRGPTLVDEKAETRYIKGGRFLRQSSIDELPQLLNVLKGEMSIVGPRPERPYFVDQYSKTIPFFKDRHIIKGGITGWAQVNGRSVLTRRPDQKLMYDLYYLKHWSFLLDIKILFKTIFVVFKREEAY